MKPKFTIKQIFTDNWHRFLVENPSLNIRSVVKEECNKLIHCGDFNAGHALYFCMHCSTFKHVPFRCKSRFCPTCGFLYKNKRAAKISSKLLNCDHRHIVFTIPAELRPVFRQRRDILAILFQAASKTILDWLYKQNKNEVFKAGIVTVLHTFGRDLKWNPHIHMLMSEGAVGKFNPWRKLSHIPYVMLRKKWQATLLHFLSKEHIANFTILKSSLFKCYPDGFYVHAKPNMLSRTQAINYIIRYVGRPAMAQSRIIAYDGYTVSFWYQRHEDNKRIVETIPVFEFIKRLIIHIQDKSFHVIRYYGYYAKKYYPHHKMFYMHKPHFLNIQNQINKWRLSIMHCFRYDPLLCSCGHVMELLDIVYPYKDYT